MQDKEFYNRIMIEIKNMIINVSKLDSISAVYTQSGTVYETDSLNSLKEDLVVTASYTDGETRILDADEYDLSGTLAAGTSTVTVSYGGKTDTFEVTVTAVELVSIAAVYTQSGPVYDTDSLDSLKSDLVVTATYNDSSTAIIPAADYTLSGTLAEGVSTVTVSYDGQTTTFSVTVTASGVLPEGYTKYDYLYSNAGSSTAGSYINTGVTFTSGVTSAEFTVVLQEVADGTGANAYPIGVRQKGTGNTNNTGWAVILNSDHTTLRAWTTSSVIAVTTIPAAYDKFTAKSTWSSESITIQCNNSPEVSASGTTRQIDQYPIILFGLKHATQAHSGTEYFFKGKIYYAEAKQNGVKIMECYPCVRDDDGVAGMYDVVNNAFYTSYHTSGSYTITAGNDTP